MTDDARLQRLTELARKVWPDGEADARASADPNECAACVVLHPDGEWQQALAIMQHPRALDALEAALCVLAGEPPPWAVELHKKWRAMANPMDRYGLKSVPAAQCLRDCADELLLVAKGKGKP
jgi:hypothetical protein